MSGIVLAILPPEVMVEWVKTKGNVLASGSFALDPSQLFSQWNLRVCHRLQLRGQHRCHTGFLTSDFLFGLALLNGAGQ